MVETTTLIIIIIISAVIIGLIFFLLWWFVWKPKDTPEPPPDTPVDPPPDDTPPDRPPGTFPCIISTTNGNVTIPSPWYRDPTNPRRCLAPAEQPYCEPTILENGTSACAASFPVENFPNTNSVNNWISINVTRTPIQFNSDLIQGCYTDSNSTDTTIYFVNGRGKTCLIGSSSGLYSRFCGSYNTPIPGNLIKGSTPNNLIPVCSSQDGNISQEVTFKFDPRLTNRFDDPSQIRALTSDNTAFPLLSAVSVERIVSSCNKYTWVYTGPRGTLKTLTSQIGTMYVGGDDVVKYGDGINNQFTFVPQAPDYNIGKICLTSNINKCFDLALMRVPSIVTDPIGIIARNNPHITFTLGRGSEVIENLGCSAS